MHAQFVSITDKITKCNQNSFLEKYLKKAYKIKNISFTDFKME